MEASVLAQLTALLEQFVEEYELKLGYEEGEVLVQAHYVIMTTARTINDMTPQDFYQLKQSTKLKLELPAH